MAKTAKGISAYPLAWPPTKPRATDVTHALFKTTLSRAIGNLKYELSLLGAEDLIISTNLPLRRDGEPTYARAQPVDPAVAVYFTYKRKAMCFASDRWNTVHDNLHAIVKTINALRGIARWGSGDMVMAAFTGFTALPMPEQPWQILKLPSSRPTKDEIDSAFKILTQRFHPDRMGGDDYEMKRINTARDELYAEFGYV